MPLYLVQHALAFTKDQDPDRDVTEVGARETELIGKEAEERGIRPKAIFHSGKTRARRTAELLAYALVPPDGCGPMAGLAPNDPPAVIADGLVPADDVMIVGHLPFLDKLTSLLVTGAEDLPLCRFRNSGIVCLDRDPDKAHWHLVWILHPKGDA